MQRYLESDDITFSEKTQIPKYVKGKSILSNYIDHLIDEFKSCFSIHYFHAILSELEELNHFKIKQISKHVQENNALMQKLFSQIQISQQPESQPQPQQPQQPPQEDVTVIHLSSTPVQPIYLSYKPVHMIYLRTKLLVRNEYDEQHLPSEGISKAFVSDLIHTKRIQILHETKGLTYDVPAKWLYFAEPCEPNVILPLKLRVLVFDTQTGQRRYGIIGEEPGKNNHYRCLIFFTDEKTHLSARYHSPSDVHLSLDQSCPISDIDDEHEFLSCYFKSYPERLMLRAKEGTSIKVRNGSSTHRNVFLPAVVVQIDCSMMLIEVCQTKQQMWIYRGSTLIEQMNNYYSTQNQAEKNLYIRHSARQHLSARKTNAPEIICLNEQTKLKSLRTAEPAVDESSLFALDNGRHSQVRCVI